MSTLLKDYYSPGFYQQFTSFAAHTVPGFEPEAFMQGIFTPGFEAMELKERMRHTATVLHRFLSPDFPEAASQICGIIRHMRQNGSVENSFPYLFFPDYIEQYGLAHLEASVQAMEEITQFISCEFAVRPFLVRYPAPMLAHMQAWAHHPHEGVRRLASEGIRPRLPWGMAIPYLKKDPAPIWPILEALKNDPSETVRRSVANNLNDISKDHPEAVLEVARRWIGLSPETDALVKHACRTLLKQGSRTALGLFGLSGEALSAPQAVLLTPQAVQGAYLEFAFTAENPSPAPRTLRLEYAVYFLLKNGTYYRKVFKISEREFQPGEKTEVTRRHSFRPITTRVYYPGQHRVAAIVNGSEGPACEFELLA